MTLLFNVFEDILQSHSCHSSFLFLKLHLFILQLILSIFHSLLNTIQAFLCNDKLRTLSKKGSMLKNNKISPFSILSFCHIFSMYAYYFFSWQSQATANPKAATVITIKAESSILRSHTFTPFSRCACVYQDTG